MMKSFVDSLKTIVLALIIGLGISYLSAWTGPIQAPPNCASGNPGCDAPINVGRSDQTKAGGVLTLIGGLKLPSGAGAGKVLTSDAVGLASWDDVPGSLDHFVVFNYGAATHSGGASCVAPICTSLGGGRFTFDVPANVTGVMIEAWGAGGGNINAGTLSSFGNIIVANGGGAVGGIGTGGGSTAPFNVTGGDGSAIVGGDGGNGGSGGVYYVNQPSTSVCSGTPPGGGGSGLPVIGSGSALNAGGGGGYGKIIVTAVTEGTRYNVVVGAGGSGGSEGGVVACNGGNGRVVVWY